MKQFMTLFLLFSSLNCLSQIEDYKTTVITDPGISRRCDTLLEKLVKKRSHKRKLSELLLRNKRLRKVTPSQKKKLNRRLELNWRRLSREMRLTRLKIQHQEENIIRKGCPGILI